MSKRSCDEAGLLPSQAKRAKAIPDRLSSLSDELLLRILHHVPLQTLTACHRISRRFETIAGDSQLWRAAYYDRFVRPRALGLKWRKSRSAQRPIQDQPQRILKWLDEADLLTRDPKTDWKKQYKIRHNWAEGSATYTDIPVASHPPIPPLLARLQGGIVYTVDSSEGLRAWLYKDNQKLMSRIALSGSNSISSARKPTAFTLDAEPADNAQQFLSVGFEDGSFDIYTYDKAKATFTRLHSHPASSRGMITALAYAACYLLSIDESQTLSLYRFPPGRKSSHGAPKVEAPLMLSSLASRTAWPPMSLSIRTMPSKPMLFASIAYSIPTYVSGWSTAVQEIRLSLDGEIVDSRLASAENEGFAPVKKPSHAHLPHTPHPVPSTTSAWTEPISRPTSLSYSHPYLLVSHSDNTLTLYLVTSTEQHLSVGPAKRLWGHTSSVFNAHVGGKGKAVSVSTRGDEIRVWELEGTTSTRGRRLGKSEDSESIQVTPKRKPQDERTNTLNRTGLRTAFDNAKADSSITRGWVGFDNENVVVLKERDRGSQSLVVYDFT
ncbi:MAG: hypothetical protein M1831_007005 [Alyxoria varia]|nr:MAG: hypothetical protein M1831_007005 [Alyxoria varia]